MITVKETCSCGASIQFEVGMIEYGKQTLTDWRAEHNHTIRPYNYPYITYGQGGSGGYGTVYLKNDDS